MAWEENPRICLHMQLIAILSRTGVFCLAAKCPWICWQQYLSTTFGRAKVSKSVGILPFLRKNMLVGCPKNEVNFMGPRSYIHRPTKLYSWAYEVNFIFTPLLRPARMEWAGRQLGVGNAAVLMGLSIPKPSRDHPKGLPVGFRASPKRAGGAFPSVWPLSLPILPLLFVFPALYIN